MDDRLQSVLVELTNRAIAFFPKLLAGIALLCIGWILAWLVKRLIIRVSVILKLEHFLGLSRWRTAFEKADVRYGFYSFLGNIFFVVIFLTFLDFALITWDLKLFSNILSNAILLFPRMAAATAIFGIGWMVARWSAGALYRGMSAENIPAASVVAFYARALLTVFFAAMSLVQLDIAREIVVIGFATIFVTLGLIAVIVVAYSRSNLFRKESADSPKDE
jgi:hypothetical protein